MKYYISKCTYQRSDWNEFENQIYAVYREKMIGENPICRDCRKNCKELFDPVGIWFVGSDYRNSRILFVGKNSRGVDKSIPTSEARTILWMKSWPYWSYTREISARLFNDSSPEHIAFTNVVKCASSATVDTTTRQTMDHCVSQLELLRQEIGILMPKKIVFYTGRGYDRYIENSFDDFRIVKEKTCTVGKKTMPWKEAIAILNGQEIKVLITGHPERKKKADYVQAILSWLV